MEAKREIKNLDKINDGIKINNGGKWRQKLE